MSARKLSALVIRLVLFYLAATYLFTAAQFLTFMIVDDSSPFPYVSIQIGAMAAFSIICLCGLAYGDHLARWIVREDWTIASEADDGSVFWSKTVPVLIVMGTGIFILGRSVPGVGSALAEIIAEYNRKNPDPESFNRIYATSASSFKNMVGSLLGLALGVLFFLRPGSLLKLFHRYGKME
jgi:hypothetical protein